MNYEGKNVLKVWFLCLAYTLSTKAMLLVHGMPFSSPSLVRCKTTNKNQQYCHISACFLCLSPQLDNRYTNFLLILVALLKWNLPKERTKKSC